jgi:hypothetical protein
MKYKKLDWSIFNFEDTNLGRIDLYYFRDLSESESGEQLELFLKNSCEKVNAKSKRASWKPTPRGRIMRIGSRQGSNYYRVYEKSNGLEFELEIKKEFVRSVQEFLFSYHIAEFEGRLVEHFYKHSKKSFVLDSCYTDWLRIGLRKIVSNQKPLDSLVSSYLSKDNLDSFVKKEQFFKLIQFLSFLRTLEFSRQFIDDQSYCVIEFPVIDFIGFTGGNMKSTYQRTKALDFFTSLQEIKPLIQKFSNNEFRRSVMFPYLKLKKQNRRWIVRMAVGEELYFYQYPFFFPSCFLTYQNKYDLKVKLQLIENFSTVELEKIFPVKNFLNQFSIPNKDRKTIKKQLINSFYQLKDSELIENEFSLSYKNGSSKKVEHLTPGMISKSEFISFYEKII